MLATEYQGELKHGEYAYVSISDTGSGMPREVMAKAFEPFFTTKPLGKGTGLGLAMVYGYFRQSDGTVRLYSEVGYGTTVSFYPPLAKVAEERPHRALQGPHIHGEGSILIVDDEVDLLEVAVSYVSDMGFTALDAKDGPGALEVLRNRTDVGLLITDIIMPRGIEWGGVGPGGATNQSCNEGDLLLWVSRRCSC
jgi:Histidine kinase-, DNA gyrase B-, and HSP90-like ATPase